MFKSKHASRQASARPPTQKYKKRPLRCRVALPPNEGCSGRQVVSLIAPQYGSFTRPLLPTLTPPLVGGAFYCVASSWRTPPSRLRRSKDTRSLFDVAS